MRLESQTLPPMPPAPPLKMGSCKCRYVGSRRAALQISDRDIGKSSATSSVSPPEGRRKAETTAAAASL